MCLSLLLLLSSCSRHIVTHLLLLLLLLTCTSAPRTLAGAGFFGSADSVLNQVKMISFWRWSYMPARAWRHGSSRSSSNSQYQLGQHA
jgi:hypothetical protein